jgi:hypothetical protein
VYVLAHAVLFLFYIIQVRRSIFISLPAYYHFCTLYTIIGTDYFSFAKEVPFDFYERINQSSLYETGLYFSLAAFSFYVGVIITKNTRRGLVGMDFSGINYVFSKITNAQIVLSYFVLLFVFHFGHGISHVYFREGYLIGDGGIPVFRSIYTMLLPLTMILLPFYRGKLVRIGLLVFVLFLVIGSSSRNMLLVPFCYYFGVVIRTNRVRFYQLILLVLIIVLLASISMQYRYNTYQGAIPNMLTLLTKGVDLELVTFAINYLISFSYIASSLTIQDYFIDYKALYASITPLPSSYIDVDYMVENQKLNVNAPFTAIGVLAQAGFMTLSLYYFCAGYIWSRFGGDLINKTKVIGLLVYVLFFLFMMLSVQYNLRSVTRFIYYLFFFWLSISFLRVIFLRRL